jgi:DNA-binding transcriptional MerR regulator/effector-binding domain-containing protein
MKDVELFKISEVANIHGVTVKSLRHYDKLGLFKPDWVDPNNGYHYYTRKNFPILKQIIYLKFLGFDLKKIRSIINDSSIDTLLKELESQYRRVKLDIKQLKTIEKNLLYLIDFHKVALSIDERDLNRPSIQILGDFYYVKRPSEENSKSSMMLSYRKLLGALRNTNSFTARVYGAYYEYDPGSDTFKSGAFINLPADIQNNDIEHVELRSSGKYVTMYHRGTYYLEEPIRYLYGWLKENAYTPIGPWYDLCIVDRTFSGDEDSMIMELQIMVK